jgi:hypothetical protein
MSQGNDFANYAASDEANAASEDVWFVAVASDDIKQMTVDQLDEAFRLGVISAQTQVWTEGMESWAPLGEVADLDGADASDSPSVSEDEEETAIARMEYDTLAQQAAAPSYSSAAAGQHSARHSPVPTQQNGFASGPSSFAPVTSSFAPTATSSSPAPLGLSSGPVALNVDEDMPSIRRGRRFRPERWLLAAAAIVGVGVTAYNNSDVFSSSVAVAETGKAAPTALAARPYEAGGGVERGASLGGTAKSGADEEESAPAETGANDKATGSSAPSSAASAPMNDAKAEADDSDGAAPSGATAKAAAKESLKGSFSKAFDKKAPAAKPRASKARKATARRAAAKPAKAPKKAGAARAGSAFDPLNDSLP